MTPSVQFAALADGTRCALVDLLRERPRAVHELAAAFSISRPAISRHLRVLKDAGLVAEERSGRENVYALKRQRLRVLSTWLEQHWSTRRPRGERPTKAQSELEF
jgi:DNA-binding transcriptional ArsR family regulator